MVRQALLAHKAPLVQQAPVVLLDHVGLLVLKGLVGLLVLKGLVGLLDLLGHSAQQAR